MDKIGLFPSRMTALLISCQKRDALPFDLHILVTKVANITEMAIDRDEWKKIIHVISLGLE